MPTYEYGCSACGHQWEQVQRIVESPVEACPKCAAKTAHRLISAGTNFILKGGGWYSDLYSSNKPKPAEASPSSSTPDGNAPAAAPKTEKAESAATTESKPAPASTPSSTSS